MSRPKPSFQSTHLSILLKSAGLAIISLSLFGGMFHYLPVFPFLWILPLAVYVLSLYTSINFSKQLNHSLLLLVKPFLILPVLIPLTIQVPANGYAWILDLIILFFICVMCHSRLFATLNRTKDTSKLLLYITGGTVIGCLMVSLWPHDSPFHGAHFVIALVLVSFVLPMPVIATRIPPPAPAFPWMDIALPIGLFIVLCVMRLIFPHIVAIHYSHIRGIAAAYTVLYCVVASAGCYIQRHTPLSFGLATAAVLMVGMVLGGQYVPYRPDTVFLVFGISNEFLSLCCAMTLAAFLRTSIVFDEKTPFGEIKVKHNIRNNTFELSNNDIIHGAQFIEEKSQMQPLTYYSTKGPLGQVFAGLSGASIKEVAIIGLGAGTIATYGKAGQNFTFYEINPAIDKIARNPVFFTFLKNSRANIKTVIGDGRKMIAEAAPHLYDMIIVDAYSGDIIPKQLMTQEALLLYGEKLTAGGLLVFHISSKSADILPVIARLAGATGYTGLVQYHDPQENAAGSRSISGLGLVVAEKKAPEEDTWSVLFERFIFRMGLLHNEHDMEISSRWAVLTRQADALSFLSIDPRWEPLVEVANTPLWTDVMVKK